MLGVGKEGESAFCRKHDDSRSLREPAALLCECTGDGGKCLVGSDDERAVRRAVWRVRLGKQLVPRRDRSGSFAQCARKYAECALASVRVRGGVNGRKTDTNPKKEEVEWYGKKAEKKNPKIGDPVICFIVGGTCFAEVGIEKEAGL